MDDVIEIEAVKEVVTVFEALNEVEGEADLVKEIKFSTWKVNESMW